MNRTMSFMWPSALWMLETLPLLRWDRLSMSNANIPQPTLSQPAVMNSILQDSLHATLPEVATRPPAADLAEVVRETLTSLRGSFHPDLRVVHLDVAADSSLVRLETEHLVRVVRILFRNALKAMPEGGLLLIEVFTTTLNEQHPKVYLGEGKPGVYAVLSLSDSGKGMDTAELSRLFEAPETIKESLRAAELGLSALPKILERCGGHVWVYSQPGMGTQFEVFLPVA